MYTYEDLMYLIKNKMNNGTLEDCIYLLIRKTFKN